MKRRRAWKKSGVFITLSKEKDHHCSMHCVLQCMLGRRWNREWKKRLRTHHLSFSPIFSLEENCMLYDPYLDSSSVCIRIPFVAKSEYMYSPFRITFRISNHINIRAFFAPLEIGDKTTLRPLDISRFFRLCLQLSWKFQICLYFRKDMCK